MELKQKINDLEKELFGPKLSINKPLPVEVGLAGIMEATDELETNKKSLSSQKKIKPIADFHKVNYEDIKHIDKAKPDFSDEKYNKNDKIRK